VENKENEELTVQEVMEKYKRAVVINVLVVLDQLANSTESRSEG
jgi:hypothetical protein